MADGFWFTVLGHVLISLVKCLGLGLDLSLSFRLGLGLGLGQFVAQVKRGHHWSFVLIIKTSLHIPSHLYLYLYLSYPLFFFVVLCCLFCPETHRLNSQYRVKVNFRKLISMSECLLFAVLYCILRVNWK